MSESPTTEGVEQTKMGLELMGMLLGGAAALCVPLGWVVSYAGLNRYRVNALELTRPGHAWAGALALATVLALFFILLGLRQFARYYWAWLKHLVDTFCSSLETGEPVSGPRWYLWPGRFQLLLAVIIAPSILILGGAKAYSLGLSQHWKICLATATVANVGIILLLSYVSSYKGQLLLRMADVSLLSVFAIVLLFLHSFFFGYTVYKDIPVYYGGGKPVPVALVFNDGPQTDRFLQQEEESFRPTSSYTESARLLAETQSDYVFLVTDLFGQEKPVFVRREMVQVRPRGEDDFLALGR